MGGWKESGLGSRHGADGIRKNTARQAILVTPLTAQPGAKADAAFYEAAADR